MIPKSGTRFSEKIMRKQMARADDDSKEKVIRASDRMRGGQISDPPSRPAEFPQSFQQ
jgi:hypothetical protein